MARGLQKLQSQAKNNEKQASKKTPSDNKKSAAAGLLFSCVVCKVNYKNAISVLKEILLSYL